MIVWLTGVTSAGKTWLGDFLQHYHGYIHIDGDQRMAVHYGKCDITDGVVRAFHEYWFDRKEAPLELWVPYYKELCDKVAEQYRKSPETDIVLSFSTYPRAIRDYVRGEIKQTTGQDLTMILLHMSIDDYAKRQKDKFVEWATAHNQTFEEIWNGIPRLKALGEYSEEKLIAYHKVAREFMGLEPIQPDEESSFTIETDSLHTKVVPEVTRILQLRECQNVDYDVIKKIRTDRLEGYAKLKKEMTDEVANENWTEKTWNSFEEISYIFTIILNCARRTLFSIFLFSRMATSNSIALKCLRKK